MEQEHLEQARTFERMAAQKRREADEYEARALEQRKLAEASRSEATTRLVAQ